jgi:glycosyltransferase involved in cell wall biosynthesis
LFYAGGPLENELSAAGIPVHHLEKRGRWDLLHPFTRLVLMLRRVRPDILHGYLPPANILAAAAIWFARSPKLVFGLRASDMEHGRYDFLTRTTLKVEAALGRYADLVISNSAAGLRAGWARGMLAGRGLVIPNGIDTERFRPDPRASERTGAYRIGMIARFDPMKDHDTFLRAAHLVAGRRNDVHFVLAGQGTEQLAGKTRNLHLEIVGALTRPEALIAELDILVMSSLFGEGFPNAVAEAMACGVPVVATDVGDASAIVGDVARLVPPGNPVALAQAMLNLIPISRDAAIRSACRQRIETHFSVATLVERTESALVALDKPLVLHVIAGLGIGGAEGMLERLVRMPGPFRHVIVSLTGDGERGERLRKVGIEVADLGMRRGLPSPVALWRLARLIRRLRPTVLQTWMYHGDLLGIIAALLAGHPPVIWNLRCSNMDFSRYRRTTRWIMHILARLSSLPKAVLVNSEAGQRWHSQLGYRPREWAVLPNGIDVEKFCPDAQARLRWRNRLGVGPNTVLVGMCARRDPMKDHETLIRAMTLVAGDIVCAMVGRGVDPADAALADLAAKSNKKIHLLGYCEDMPGFMAALDIAVLASSFGEGFPNVVAEAMACAVPCVVTDVGDAALIVGCTGKVVAPGDASALANSISALAADPGERARLGTLARDRIVMQYTLPVVASRYHELWTRFAQKRRYPVAPSGRLSNWTA